MKANLVELGIVLIYAIISSLSLVFMRRGFSLLYGKGFMQYLNFNILLPIFGYGFSFLLWILIVSRVTLTTSYPIATGLIFVLVYIFSIFLLSESITLHGIIGSSFVIIGILIILLK